MIRPILAHGEGHRDVAAEWHGGQASALYAYASTGSVVDGLLTEISDCRHLAYVEGKASEVVRLEAFRDYVQAIAGYPQPDQLIHDLLDVATDDEADTLIDLLVRCGYWWQCDHGYFKAGEPCDVCGRTS